MIAATGHAQGATMLAVDAPCGEIAIGTVLGLGFVIVLIRFFSKRHPQ